MDNINFQTPPLICKYMSELLPTNAKTVLEPTHGAGNLVNELKKYKFDITAPDDFWKLDKNSRFDAICMNPPFTPMKVGYDILFRCMEMSDYIIALMPWLTLINSEGRSKKIMQFGLRSIFHLPRKIFPGSRVQTCILQLDKQFANCSTMLYLDYNRCI